MKLKDIVVIHKIFGEGIIAEVSRKGENTYILVNFIREVKEFAFPGIFETAYMRFKDEWVQNKFNEEYGKKTSVKQIDAENVNEKYIKDYNSIRQLKVYATKAVYTYNMRPRLIADLLTYYGTNSQKIYLACCGMFGWKSYLSSNFGRQGALLFAQDATPEGYDVWFLPNNNYTNTTNSNWINKISDNQDIIYELWTDNGKSMDTGRERIVFVKTTNGKFVFLGIYVAKNKFRVDNGSRLRVFKRVSETYPVEI